MSFKGLALEGVTDGFELPGSTPHYPPSLYFKISYMSLTIEPKLRAEEPTLMKCQEKLDIIAKRDIDEIQFDIAEIKVDSVFSTPYLCQKTKTYDIVRDQMTELKFNDSDKDKEDKLTITLSQALKNGDSICIIINYSAGYDAEKRLIKSPRSGFHFIRPDNYYKTKPYQAWTQGQATESRYWFPCLDDPQVKFPRELHVIVPEEYIVISNGISEYKEEEKEGKDSEKVDDINKIEWIWRELSPIQTYVTSVVIGKFKMKEEIYGKETDRPIRLLYYWPENIERKGYDPKLTFAQTQEFMKFFESYLHINYPYKKYSQVAVEDFDIGGMENTSCTTLPSDLFHDNNALPNYTFDDEIIRHELAHQWFGDLVTCRDWQDIWLNEGFATYFDALYLDQEYINNTEKAGSSRDDFYHYMLTNIMSAYFRESIEYKRRIVTKNYKDPDDLFDSHSYQKGACVLHMLRNYIGENNFRESLRIYLDRYKNGTVETDDLRKVLEEVSGISLQQFFEQWLYREGHPVLNIEFVIEKDVEKKLLKIKIKQIKKVDAQTNIKELAKDVDSEKLVDEKEAFVFPLEIKLCSSDLARIESAKKFSFDVLKNENEFTINLTEEGIKNLHYVSVDPELKILREINSIKFEDKEDSIKHIDILKNQLLDGETVIEKIEAIRYLEKDLSKHLIPLLKNTILNKKFYGVSAQAANTLGSYSKVKDENMKKGAYNALKSLFDKDPNGKSHFSELDPRIKTSVISAFSSFNTKESMDDYIYTLINDKNYYVASQAILSLGRITSQLSKDKKITLEQKKEKIGLLKSIIKKEFDPDESSFKNLKAGYAIYGLASFANDQDEDIVLDIADFLILCSEYGKEHFIRRDAIYSLGNFLRYKIRKNGKEIDKFNDKVFEQLKNVMKAARWSLQARACQAIIRKLPDKPDDKLMETMDVLTWIAEHDTDRDVRREAEKSINAIRKRILGWLEKPMGIDNKIRQERDKLHEKVLQAREARLLGLC